jgi:hypothetical protein
VRTAGHASAAAQTTKFMSRLITTHPCKSFSPPLATPARLTQAVRA